MMVLKIHGPDEVHGSIIEVDAVPQKGDYLLIEEVEYRVEKVVWLTRWRNMVRLTVLRNES